MRAFFFRRLAKPAKARRKRYLGGRRAENENQFSGITAT